jgi:hypothetical protein
MQLLRQRMICLLYVRRSETLALLGVLLLSYNLPLSVAGSAVDRGSEFSPIAYAAPVRLAELQNKEIIESSGLAPSRRAAGVFWTHNDSGDEPRIFAFDERGQHLATVGVGVKEAHDWEDMASFESSGTSYLLIGDVGNSRKKNALHLHLLVEPDPYDAPMRIRPVRTVSFHFRDGNHDCESVAFDARQNKVLLATKSNLFVSRIYEMNWPSEETEKLLHPDLVGSVSVPLAVAMDISYDAQRAIVLSYLDARVYPKTPNESWREAFARTGTAVRMPIRRQGESICFGPRDLTLYLTSEKLPTPLFQVKPTHTSPESP